MLILFFYNASSPEKSPNFYTKKSREKNFFNVQMRKAYSRNSLRPFSLKEPLSGEYFIFLVFTMAIAYNAVTHKASRHYNTRLTVLFRDYADKPVPER